MLLGIRVRYRFMCSAVLKGYFTAFRTVLVTDYLELE